MSKTKKPRTRESRTELDFILYTIQVANVLQESNGTKLSQYGLYHWGDIIQKGWESHNSVMETAGRVAGWFNDVNQPTEVEIRSD